MTHHNGTPFGDLLASEAINTIGHCYTFGGAPGIHGGSCWDCSSACNYWVGAVVGLDIPGYPGGSYDGAVHGPSTVGWLDWIDTGVIIVERSKVTAGDLMVWQTHMGMAINNREMVSAANPADGTIRSGIDGFIPGEQLFPLRLKQIAAGQTGIPFPVTIDSRNLRLAIRDVAREVERFTPLRERLRPIGRPSWLPTIH